MKNERLRRHFTGNEEDFQEYQKKVVLNTRQAVEEYRTENNASDGETALEAISIYNNCRLDPPAWAIKIIHEAWELYKSGRDKKMLRGDRLPADLNTVLTFDEALGLKSRKGRTKTKKRLSDV